MQNIKLIAIILFIILLSVLGYFMINKKPKTAVINIPVTSFDFQKVKYGDIPTHDFEIQNTGKADLIINKITTSCGCTTAEIDKMTIAPNDSAIVTVSFNPAIHKDDTDLGELTRIIYIDTNDPISPESEIKIYANVYKEIIK